MENTTQKTSSRFPKYKLIVGGVLLIIIFGLLAVSLNRSSAPSSEKKAEIKPSPSISTIEVDNLVPKSPDTGKPIEGQIVVKVKGEATETQINQLLLPYQAKIISKIESLNSYVIQVPTGQENTVLKALSESKLIEHAEPDYEIHADFRPNDPLYTSQWGLANTGQPIKNISGTAGADVKAESAWNVTRGNNIKVAVIDSGINLNHPDFAGQIIAQRTYIGTSVEDQYGHGTHVAGAVAALGNNTQGITGVCPECKLVIAKVLNDQGSGASSNVASAISWAADQGAKVINISAGGSSPTQLMQDAIDYANSKGAIVVCSAGNDGNTAMKYPAAYDLVVSVAATDNKDLLGSFSTRGTWVKVAAPGVNMLSTFPTHSFNLQTINPTPLNTTNDFLSGTSMAAPIVSGVLGLIWASPHGTSNTAVVQRLYSTADKISGTGTYWTHGRINAAKAVGADAITPTNVPSTAPTVSSTSPTPTSPVTLPTDVLMSPPPTVPAPTFTCLGACVTVSPSVQPVTTAPSLTPGGTGGNPSTGNPGQTNCRNGLFSRLLGSRCNNNPNPSTPNPSTPSRGGFLQILTRLFQSFFGIFGGRPTPPATAPTPIPPTTVPATPTAIPQTPTIAPTNQPSPTGAPTPTEDPAPTSFCAQVITKGKNIQTQECKEFPTSCLPDGWTEDPDCVLSNSFSRNGD